MEVYFWRSIPNDSIIFSLSAICIHYLAVHLSIAIATISITEGDTN